MRLNVMILLSITVAALAASSAGAQSRAAAGLEKLKEVLESER